MTEATASPAREGSPVVRWDEPIEVFDAIDMAAQPGRLIGRIRTFSTDYPYVVEYEDVVERFGEDGISQVNGDEITVRNVSPSPVVAQDRPADPPAVEGTAGTAWKHGQKFKRAAGNSFEAIDRWWFEDGAILYAIAARDGGVRCVEKSGRYPTVAAFESAIASGELIPADAEPSPPAEGERNRETVKTELAGLVEVIESYGLGDRPQSPPASLLRQRRELEVELASLPPASPVAPEKPDQADAAEYETPGGKTVTVWKEARLLSSFYVRYQDQWAFVTATGQVQKCDPCIRHAVTPAFIAVPTSVLEDLDTFFDAPPAAEPLAPAGGEGEQLPDNGGPGQDMSLRDYFAGQALAGCMAYYNGTSGDHHTNGTPQATAEMCYRLADAMLAASRPAIRPAEEAKGVQR